MKLQIRSGFALWLLMTASAYGLSLEEAIAAAKNTCKQEQRHEYGVNLDARVSLDSVGGNLSVIAKQEGGLPNQAEELKCRQEVLPLFLEK